MFRFSKALFLTLTSVFIRSAPRVGLEPTTTRLTAECSTIELSRIISLLRLILYSLTDVPSKPNKHYLLSLIFSLPDFRLQLWSSPRPISTYQLNTLLCLHLKPIYLILSEGSYHLAMGISHLEGGFTLRCLQRLSLPDLATLPWLWQANRYTSGPSIPVLSY